MGAGFGPIKVADGVYWVGVNDTVTKRFENMWPIPDGISYNAYVLEGSDGYVAVDGVKDIFADEYFSKLSQVVGDLRRIKYVVVNHLEPDHQGTLEELLRRAPEARVLISSVGARMIGDFYDVPRERVLPVSDGDVVNAAGRRLRFVYAPWLHWPETMMTLDLATGVLFTCDAFGSYVALPPGRIFDDEVDLQRFVGEAKRYYVNIVGRYTKNTLDALAKLERVMGEVKVIAPAHGPVYRSNPRLPLELYRQWAEPVVDPEVAVLYISMYGHTARLVQQFRERVESRGASARVIDVAEEHVSYVLSETNNSAAVAVLFPTYDSSIPMPLNDVLYTYQVKMFGRGRPAGVVTDYGWGPVAKAAAEALTKAGFKVLEPLVTLHTRPRPDELARLLELADRLAEAALAAAKK